MAKKTNNSPIEEEVKPEIIEEVQSPIEEVQPPIEEVSPPEIVEEISPDNDTDTGKEGNESEDDVYSKVVTLSKQLVSDLEGIFIGGVATSTRNQLLEVLAKV